MKEFKKLFIKCSTKKMAKFMDMYNIQTMCKYGYNPDNKFLVEQIKDKENLFQYVAIDLMYTEKQTYWGIDFVQGTMYDIMYKKWHKYINAANDFAEKYQNRMIDMIPLEKNLYKEEFVINYLTHKGFRYEIEQYGKHKVAIFTIMPENKKEFCDLKKDAKEWYDIESTKLMDRENILDLGKEFILDEEINKIINEEDNRFEVKKMLLYGGIVTLHTNKSGAKLMDVNYTPILETDKIKSKNDDYSEFENLAELEFALRRDYDCDLGDFSLDIWRK